MAEVELIVKIGRGEIMAQLFFVFLKKDVLKLLFPSVKLDYDTFLPQIFAKDLLKGSKMKA